MESKCQKCRRAGEKLFLKGDRCVTPKCAVVRKPYPPGMHSKKMSRGRGRSRSEYGAQLATKQKIKRIYGVLERQFRHHFEEARKRQGVVGDNLLSRLEMRLDNVVYRVGFAVSRQQARQLVNHGFIEVKGKKVDIPSCEVRVGSTLAIRESKKNTKQAKEIQSVLKNKKDFPSWVTFDENTLVATINRQPARDDIEFGIDPQVVVEYYSR